MTTWTRRCGSPSTAGRSRAISRRSSRPVVSNRAVVAVVARSTTSPTSTRSWRYSILPASIFSRSSTSLINAESRSPSATTISRLSPTWRTARSRRGSSGAAAVSRAPASAGSTTSSSRSPDDLREADDRGQRRPQLVTDVGEELALRRAHRLGRRPRRLGLLGRLGQLGGPPRDARLELAVLVLDLAVQPGVLDGRREEVADGREQRPDRPLDVPPREPVVDREDPDRPALRLERRAEERGHVERPGEDPVGLVGVVLDVAEDERPVGQGELDERRIDLVERQPDRRDERLRVRSAADAPAVGEDAGLLVDEQDERPVERQMVDDRGQRRVEEALELERRADRGRDLVERDELREAALELGSRAAGFLGLAGESLALALRLALRGLGLARPARRRRPVQDQPGRQDRRQDDRERLPPRRLREEDGEDRQRAADADDQLDGPDACGSHGDPPGLSAPRCGSRRPGSGPGRSPGRSARRSRSGP